MLRLVSLLGAAAFAVTGCYQIHHGYDGPMRLTTSPALAGETEMVRRLEEHDRQFFWILGLIPVGERANGAELLAHAADGHDAVVNVQISDGQDPLDLLVSNTVCLLSLLCGSWSVWAEGDVVDFVGSDVAASPELAAPAPGDVP
jgi:hypothetical protein